MRIISSSNRWSARPATRSQSESGEKRHQCDVVWSIAMATTKAEKPKGAATELIHAGEIDRAAVAPLTTPIYETTTFVFDSEADVVAYNEGRSARHLYSRYTNPTVIAAEQKLAALDRAEAALLFSSGQGATSTILLAHAHAGDEVVCSAAIYGGTLHLLEDLLAKLGITPRFVSLEQLANPETIVGDATRIV